MIFFIYNLKILYFFFLKSDLSVFKHILLDYKFDNGCNLIRDTIMHLAFFFLVLKLNKTWHIYNLRLSYNNKKRLLLVYFIKLENVLNINNYNNKYKKNIGFTKKTFTFFYDLLFCLIIFTVALNICSAKLLCKRDDWLLLSYNLP